MQPNIFLGRERDLAYLRELHDSGKPELFVLYGRRRVGKTELLQQFCRGRRAVYFLGMANMLYGVDADIDRTLASRHEHFRRLGEIAHLMLDAGLVFIVSAAELRADDLDILRVSVPGEQLLTVWYGPAGAAEIATDLSLADGATIDEASAAMTGLLVARGVLPS